MATKRKKKQPADSEAPKRAKPRKRVKKRKAAKKRRAGAARTSGTKRTRRPLQLVLSIADIPINSPALAPLSDAQRVDLAAMDSRKTLSTRPAWAADETVWRKAVRVVGPHWKRLRHPWPVVAWAYLRMDGAVGHARGLDSSRDDEQPRGKRRAAARPRSSARSQYADEHTDEGEAVRVERLRVDATGIDETGTYRGQGVWWRVWNASLDSIVRAATATAARAIVTGRAH